MSEVVSKIESGLVTVKTPTRHYTISSKAINAVCRVGDKGSKTTFHSRPRSSWPAFVSTTSDSASPYKPVNLKVSANI